MGEGVGGGGTYTTINVAFHPLQSTFIITFFTVL